MTNLRFGIIGAGGVAVRNHIPNLVRSGHVDLAFACRKGREPLEKIRDHYGFEHASEDVDDAWDLDLDAVVVSSPHHLHFEHAKAALERGLHVFCEKPMTLKATEAWELAGLAEERGLHMMIANGWNYSPHFDIARETILGGGIGDVEAISCVHASPIRNVLAGDRGRAKWDADLVQIDLTTWQLPEQGGGFAHGQIGHAAALFLWMTGLSVEWVQGRTSNAGAAVDLHDAVSFICNGGVLGDYFGSGAVPDDCPFQLEIRIFGSGGLIHLDLERPRFDILRHDGAHRRIDVGPDDWAYRLDHATLRFVDLVRGAGGENRSPGDLGARCVELSEALLLSAGAGGAGVQIGPNGKMTLSA